MGVAVGAFGGGDVALCRWAACISVMANCKIPPKLRTKSKSGNRATLLRFGVDSDRYFQASPSAMP